MKYSGPLGVSRPLGIAPLATLDVAQEAAIVGDEASMARQEFIENCQQSESSEKFVRNYAAAFVGEDTAQEIPTDQIRESSKPFCEGVADFLGF